MDRDLLERRGKIFRSRSLRKVVLLLLYLYFQLRFQ